MDHGPTITLIESHVPKHRGIAGSCIWKEQYGLGYIRHVWVPGPLGSATAYRVICRFMRGKPSFRIPLSVRTLEV